ncbi:MAG: hypothetical protein KAI25_13325, partial [Hyphomicrobiaceae bacterium]|nr:hypothetical protein [Hyphomicrobiaceae bacterium]
MGRLITQGASAGLPGMEMLPKQRAFNTQGIIASVMGLAFDGTGLNPSDIADLALELEAWLLNLDDDPTGDRAFAVANYSITAQTTAGDFFEFLLSDVIASGVQGFSFNGRIEIEITHSPDGQFPNQQNHEPMQFDLLVEGVFSVQENDVLMLSHFDGADLATVADDVSPWNGFLEFGGAAELDTAQSVFGGSSILLDGIDSYVRTPGRRDFDLADEWTVEFRVRWAVVGTSALFGQMDGSGADSWFLVWNDAGDQFQIQYTTNGVNGPFINALHTGTFLPVVDTWYAIRICKDPDDVFHTFVDGVQVGTANTVAASWFRSWSDITIGASWFVGVIGNPHDGWIDEIRFTPRCLSRSDYTVDTAAFTDARRNYPLLSHFEAADEATAYTDESLYGNVLNFGSLGTTKIATEQSAFGAASVEMGGTNAQGAACDGILVPFQ